MDVDHGLWAQKEVSPAVVLRPKEMVVSRGMGNPGANLLAPRAETGRVTTLSLGFLTCQMGIKGDQLLVQVNVR